MYIEVYVCRKQVVIVHKSFVLNVVSTDVVAIIHRSFVLEWVCTVLVGKVQGALCNWCTYIWELFLFYFSIQGDVYVVKRFLKCRSV